MSALPEIPGPPHFALDWDALDTLPFVRALRGVRQDPIHHAEGDVWIHTRMVLEALLANEAYRSLDPDDRAVVFLGALLHDVSKPETTREEEDGRITARGHSRLGEHRARRILYRAELAPPLRERVCTIIRHHQVPFFLIERSDALRLAIEISLGVPARLLALVTESDARGRVCGDQQKLLDHIELYREQCRELACFEGPYSFVSDCSRFSFFRSNDRAPRDVYDDTTFEVVLLSGLPASGKSRWVSAHAGDRPVITLDDLRAELDVDPDEPQGEVVQEARRRARELCRSGTPFVLNATHLTRRMRKQWIDLCAGYGARIRVVHVEASESTIRSRNAKRRRPVPAAVLERMIERWEPPDETEAHAIDRAPA